MALHLRREWNGTNTTSSAAEPKNGGAHDGHRAPRVPAAREPCRLGYQWRRETRSSPAISVAMSNGANIGAGGKHLTIVPVNVGDFVPQRKYSLRSPDRQGSAPHSHSLRVSPPAND